MYVVGNSVAKQVVSCKIKCNENSEDYKQNQEQSKISKPVGKNSSKINTLGQ